MKQFFSRHWNTISSIGVKPGMDPQHVRTLQITNRISVVGILGLFLGSLHTFYVQDYFLATAIFGFMVVFAATLLFSFFGMHRIGVYYMLFIINIAIFYFNGYCGPDGGVYFYYFPITLVIAFLFDFTQVRHLLVFLAVTGAFLLVSIYTGHKLFFTGTLTGWQIERMWNFNLFNSMLFVFYFTYIIMTINHNQLAGFNQRMKERRESEEKIKLALREKETLLAEVHHRVKNNLSVVSSLLNLQSNLVNNDYTRDVLIESRNRVASMALIHQKLYGNNSFAELNFTNYITDLVSEIRQTYPDALTRNVTIDLQGDPTGLELTTAIPCGLILNELLSNCYKHAFTGRPKGNIRILFRQEGNDYLLRVSDDGNGLPEDFDPEQSSSLGTTIISSLAEQIDAEYGFEKNEGSGTVFHMHFSRVNPAE
ncbi:MAG: signal transduction histidine kinase [Bacteroidetes bacterium]|nr:MAG: signal transduction histidine kinase [Bacteroidota bacterium]